MLTANGAKRCSAVVTPRQQLRILAGEDFAPCTHPLAPFRGGSVRIGAHIAYMADAFPPKYELMTRPCTIHAGRYRWVITGNGKPVQTSLSSFETPAMGHADGDVTLEKLIRSSMIGQRAQRLRRAKKKLRPLIFGEPPRGGLPFWVGHFMNVRLWPLADMD